MYRELETDTLGEVLTQHQKVMVQFGASWCGNCKITKPKFRKLSESHPDIEFIYLDAEKLPGSRKLAEVTNLPTFAGFENGQLIKQNQGNKLETIQEVIYALTGN